MTSRDVIGSVMAETRSSGGGELIRESLWFDDGFTTIPNSWARDPRITNQSRGLLTQIASHKAGYRVSINGLVASSLNGRDAIQAQLNELQRAGYLVRSTYRDRGLKRYRYRLRDPHSPVDISGQGRFDLGDEKERNPRSRQYPENPYTGKPYTGKPSPGNPDAIEEQVKNKDPQVLNVTTEAAVDKCPSGHPLVDDRHCAFGCLVDDERAAS